MKNINFKKIIAGIMSVSMMFSLGACSGGSDGGSTDGDTTTNQRRR